MNLLIIRSSIQNLEEYSIAHVQKIKNINKKININIVDPKKEIVAKFLPNTEIVICPRRNFSDFLDISRAKKLKWIHITSAGVGEMISILNNYHITLTNSSGVSPIPIAEHVFTYLLMFTRQIDQAYNNQLNNVWNSPTPEELYNKTIGIIGFGRVGKRIAEIAKAFGMNIYASNFRRRTDDPLIKTEKNIKKILSNSDYVIDCLPLTEMTKNYFSLEKFKQMKKTAYFINVGIGQTVNEEDLIKALENKIIAGAGLDVYEKEPLPSTSKLWKLKNVILTSHNAGKTPFYTDRVIDIFCDNLTMYLKNKSLPNKIDMLMGY